MITHVECMNVKDDTLLNKISKEQRKTEYLKYGFVEAVSDKGERERENIVDGLRVLLLFLSSFTHHSLSH